LGWFASVKRPGYFAGAVFIDSFHRKHVLQNVGK
jgi:hypothetical protein